MIERTVSFASGELTLTGTVALPDGRGPFPALLLLQGSGPTDRDGNQPPALIADLLKQIAHALAGRGVASLRFDKRASGPNDNAFAGPVMPEAMDALLGWAEGTL